MLATVYAANAMSVSVPLAGPGLAAAYLFRRFTRLGAGALLAGWTLLAGGVISTAAWVLVLAAGGLASGHTVALAITVPALALAIVAATIAVAARYPRLRAVLENFLTQALKQGARLLRWPATDPKLALRAWAGRFGALRLPPSNWALALGDSLVNWFADAAVLTVGILAVGARRPVARPAPGLRGGDRRAGPVPHPRRAGHHRGRDQRGAGRIGHARPPGRRRRGAVPADQLLVHRRRGVADPAVPAGPQARGGVRAGTRAGAGSRGSRPQREPSAHELVLLHGQPGSAADWDAVLARLPAHLHAVAKDRPGYGASQRQAAGFTANAQVVLDDLDERGVDSAVLVAHSWAGGVALQAARLAPHRVKAVVLLAGVGPGSVSIVDWLLAAPVIGPLSAQVMWRWTPWIARARLAWLSRRQGRPLYPGEHLSLQVWGQKGGGVEPLWRAFLTEQRALLSELAELEAALPSIGVPVLLLADPADQIVPIMTAQRLASELPDARLRLISHASHHLPRRAPGAVAEAITGFLAAIDDSQPVDNLSCPG